MARSSKKKTMVASKENATKALKIVKARGFENHASNEQDDAAIAADHAFVVEFLEAAHRKLPRNAAYKRDAELRPQRKTSQF